MPALVITGAQWGDEGKGKLVDYLTAEAEWVVRFQGGNNAGHTLVVNGKKTKLQLVPCGILRPKVKCLVGAGVVANPDVLIKEIENLKAAGVSVEPGRFFIDRDAHLIMDYHPAIDLAREERLGDKKIGTTGRGVGPAYEDRAARSGVRFADLADLPALKTRVEYLVAEKNLYLKAVLGSSHQLDFQEVWKNMERAHSYLFPFVGNGSLEIHKALVHGQKVIFEGAQAALLDQAFGTVPYVTSSHTIAGAVCIGCGIGPRRIDYVLGVAKAYSTRVGSGPFPTELQDSLGDRMRERGVEFGTVTGRPRRCGWIDLVALKRAIRLNGYDSIAITKLDVLSGFDSVKICTEYVLNGKRLDDMPALGQELEGVVPTYKELPGWGEDLTSVTSWKDLPTQAREYIEVLQELLECPISLVSVGAEREATIFLDSGRYLKNFSMSSGG